MKTFLNALSRSMDRLGRARTREVLLRQSDRMLGDAGFSRELLLSGVDAWPWRTETVEPTVRRQPTAPTLAGVDRPHAPLQGRTDAEPAFDRDERIAA